ncbi:MAG: hypothetical protein ACYTFY_00455 [Planctomycetota bacterium]|jgi:uncharacterized protein (DUF2225 family)
MKITHPLLIISISVLSSLLTSCGKGDKSLSEIERMLDYEMSHQEIKVIRIALLSHDLGEKFEERGNFKKALKYYKQAEWGFNFSKELTDERHPLIDDIKEAIKRLNDKEEAFRDLKYIK